MPLHNKRSLLAAGDCWGSRFESESEPMEPIHQAREAFGPDGSGDERNAASRFSSLAQPGIVSPSSPSQLRFDPDEDLDGAEGVAGVGRGERLHAQPRISEDEKRRA